jgi:hypothetical protein
MEMTPARSAKQTTPYAVQPCPPCLSRRAGVFCENGTIQAHSFVAELPASLC